MEDSRGSDWMKPADVGSSSLSKGKNSPGPLAPGNDERRDETRRDPRVRNDEVVEFG